MDGATMWELWKVNCSGKIGEGNQNTKYYHKVTDKFLPPPLFFPQYLLTWTQEHSKPRNSHQTWTERAPREAVFFCFKEPEDSMAQRECRKLFFIIFFFYSLLPKPSGNPRWMTAAGAGMALFSLDQGNSGPKSVREVPIAFLSWSTSYLAPKAHTFMGSV